MTVANIRALLSIGHMTDTEKTEAMGWIATKPTWYDYENQAWVENGKYVRCGHPEHMNCGCYGKAHEGEAAQDCPMCRGQGRITLVDNYGVPGQLDNGLQRMRRHREGAMNHPDLDFMLACRRRTRALNRIVIRELLLQSERDAQYWQLVALWALLMCAIGLAVAL